MVTQNYLKEWFIYDTTTGNLLWRKRRFKSSVKIGDAIGSRRKDGYVVCRVQGESYYLHRLVYLFHNNVEVYHLDHINGCKYDNRIENLREVTEHENVANARRSSNNTTGIKGVSLDKKSGLYVSQVFYKGVRARKCFKTLDEATMWVRRTRVSMHGEFANHG